MEAVAERKLFEYLLYFLIRKNVRLLRRRVVARYADADAGIDSQVLAIGHGPAQSIAQDCVDTFQCRAGIRIF